MCAYARPHTSAQDSIYAVSPLTGWFPSPVLSAVVYDMHTSPARQRCLMHARIAVGRGKNPPVPVIFADNVVHEALRLIN